MSDPIATLFREFDRGLITRRALLGALGVAAVMRPVSAFAQGSCGGANASLPRCDKTPAKLPFAATGWKTVLLDHFSMHVADHSKEAAYFQALMNWKIRSDDGTQAVLDIGDWGGLVIKGGYAPPPPPMPTPEQAAAAAARAAGAGAAGAAGGGAAGGGAGGGGGRGGGRGGGGGRGPRLATFTGFCWGIEPWDAKKVESELKKRGLDPVADNSKDFQSFHVKDPGGLDLQISNGNAKNRRRTPANGKTSAPAPFDSTNWKTVWLDHISFECANYKENVAFYTALLGWTPGQDEGSQNQCRIGDIGDLIIRGGNPAGGPITPRPNGMGHIAFGIDPWDADAVAAELQKRGLNARVDTGGNGDIHTAKYQSYHTTTPNGYDLQISNVTRTTRGS